jgi:hypothetical protein
MGVSIGPVGVHARAARLRMQSEQVSNSDNLTLNRKKPELERPDSDDPSAYIPDFD